MSGPQEAFSVDRPVFAAVAISASSGQVFFIPGVEHIVTSKSVDGEKGTFSFTAPLRNEQTQALNEPLLAYAAVAGPMDLIALYAARTSINDQDQTPALPFGPLAPLSSLTYGSPAATVTAALGSASCLMVGMVDKARARVTMSDDAPDGEFYCEGSDLTKVFFENDTNVPEAAQSAMLADPSNPNNAVNPVLLAVEAFGTGAALVLAALDIMVAKSVDPSVLPYTTGSDTTALTAYLNSNAFKALGKYGYPWRNFIVVKAPYMDINFQPLGKTSKYPPYAIQQGSAWANMTDLRNAPVTRLFVDELGRLVFDDQFTAWTQQPSSGNIDATDIAQFEYEIDDSELITSLAVYPLAAQAGMMALAGVKGVGASVGFVDGLAALASTPTMIPKWGNRYARFDSLWDVTQDDVARRRKVIVREHNSLFRATVVVRGQSYYRVGQRYVLNAPPIRPEVTNALWYIDAIEHDALYNDHWDTTLHLRFPQTPDGAYH